MKVFFHFVCFVAECWVLTRISLISTIEEMNFSCFEIGIRLGIGIQTFPVLQYCLILSNFDFEFWYTELINSSNVFILWEVYQF